MIAAVLRNPDLAPEVMTVLPDSSAFYFRPYKMIYDRLVESHFADEPMDPLWIAETLGAKLATAWRISEKEAADRCVDLARTPAADARKAVDFSKIVKRHADFRALALLTDEVSQMVEREEDEPSTIASRMSAQAMKIATDRPYDSETFSYRELGRRWVKRMKEQMLFRKMGIELGAYFELPFLDDYLKGLRPTELFIIGGEPGSGKTGLVQVAAENFARRQMKKSVDQRISTLFLSMEMGEEPSSTRLAQRAGGMEGDRLREARITEQELYRVAQGWAQQQDLPLYYDHASLLSESQLRAKVSEEVRKHNVGLLIIDHFRMIEPDNPNLNRNESDDQIVKFLKMSLAKDLNLAVICLAHTIKQVERMDKRPRLSDLRGSGAVSAFADFVAFVYRPWTYATDEEREAERFKQTDAELIYAKSRHSATGTGFFHLNLSKMEVRERLI